MPMLATFRFDSSGRLKRSSLSTRAKISLVSSGRHFEVDRVFVVGRFFVDGLAGLLQLHGYKGGDTAREGLCVENFRVGFAGETIEATIRRRRRSDARMRDVLKSLRGSSCEERAKPG